MARRARVKRLGHLDETQGAELVQLVVSALAELTATGLVVNYEPGNCAGAIVGLGAGERGAGHETTAHSVTRSDW